MATAKGAEYDKIQGLDLGADYYLTKPFGVMELVSCVKAVLRRCQMQAPAHLLQSGGISVDLDAHTVTADGQRVALTFKEFELLRLFLSASRHGLHARPAHGKGLGHGLLRRNAHD